MRIVCFIFSILIFASCSKDEDSYPQADQDLISLKESEQERVRRDCPLDISITGMNENGCCVYSVNFTPRKKGRYYLQVGNQQMLPTAGDTYSWKVVTCDEVKVCLMYEHPQGNWVQRVCCETLTCYEADCDLEVDIDEIIHNDSPDCSYRICVREEIETRSNDCAYDLLVDGINQGASGTCCWDITIPEGESGVVSVTGPNGVVCYEETLECEEAYNCCDDLEHSVCCPEPYELDCYQFTITLNPEACTDWEIRTVGVKNGRLSPEYIQGSQNIIVCDNNPPSSDPIGVSVVFETEECGGHTTPYFFPTEILEFP